ncbi:MAG: ATP-binding cassette domain-containing protein [Bacillota bacterium]|nr:MAG: ATP-binding cassette domain-containing protein [Bacillota bacterium]
MAYVAIVRFDNFSFQYRDSERPAVANLDLGIQEGQIVLITGASGAGKTSACLAMNGLIPQLYRGEMKGKVILHEEVDNKTYPVYALSRICGLLFQDPDAQLVAPTVRDEIAFGPENYCMPPDEIRARIDELVDLTRLHRYLDRNPHYLSGGEKQACALAATLAMSPNVLVLDEPTSNIDPIGTTVVFDLLRKLVKDFNLTIVIVEHKLEELMELVDRLVVLDQGRVVLDGNPREVLEQVEQLVELGLSLPQVTLLMARLRERGFPVPGLPATTKEAVSMMKDMLPDPGRTRRAAQAIEFPFEPAPRVNGEVVVKVEGLRHTYDDGTEALKGIDLEIRRGEFVGILGQNGSGKTTLVKHLNGLLRPSAGRLWVMGKDTSGMTIAELAAHVGYVFQDPDAQIFKSKVFEEIAYGPKNLGLPKEEIDARVREAAEAMQITSLLGRNPFFLSKGEKQRVAVASVLSMKPEMVVLDEPTTGQDQRGSHEIMDLAKALNQEGKTVIVITHSMALAAEYCERIVVLKGGTLLLDSPVRETFAAVDILKESALKPPQLMLFAQQLSEYGLPGGFRTVEEAVEYFVRLKEALV